MKVIFQVLLAFAVVCGFALWWVFIGGHPFSKEAFLALINVFSVVAATIATYIITTERDEQKFRRELLDKFLDDAGHWAYFPEGIKRLKNKTHEGYFAGLCARYHRVRAGIEDSSDLEEFGRRWDKFKKEVECYRKSSHKDGKQLEEAIWGMTDFLRSHYLK